MNYLSILITSSLTTGKSSLPQLLKEQLVQLEQQEDNNHEQISQKKSTAQITPPEFMQSDEISSDSMPKLVLKKEEILEKTRKKLASKCFSKSRAVQIKMRKMNSSDFSCNATKSLRLVTKEPKMSEQSPLKLLFASKKLKKFSPGTSKLYSQIIFRHRLRYEHNGAVRSFDSVVNATHKNEVLPTLYFGNKGIPVKILQRLLIYNGYAISVDGIFGALTETAVKAFQNQRDLGVDGVVGNKTWRALSQ